MLTLHDSLLSSSARRLNLRRRPDLVARRHRYQGRSYWVVKDPVGLRYFRFQEEEYAILQMLDGTVSLDEVKRRFEAEFPPQKINVEELHRFVGMLHRSNLVVADVPGQGLQLKKRRDETRRKELLGAVSNILAIRFKGVDPERFLNWLYPKVRWLLSRRFVIASLLFALSALLLVLVQFDVFRSKLPAFHEFFNLKNALWFAVVLAVTKVFHELGHALSCKHFGGECHEIGVLILVLTPCLYCNVSDSWLLPNKWHRAAIGAAGMWVEVVIAAVCTYIWWFTEPGLLNFLCLSTMFVCSVSTIIFNGNPLLRYDGYYILSDLVEIPNLRQKSTKVVSHLLGQHCLGLEMPEDPFLPQRGRAFFALYTVAAVVYRWVVVFSILLFLNEVFKPYGLQAIGHLIMAMAIVGLIGMPIVQVTRFFLVPGRLAKVKKPRLAMTAAVVGILVLFVAAVPLPHRVWCALVIEPRDAAPVYVETPGHIAREPFVRPGQTVQAGAPILQLANPELALELADLNGRVQRAREQVEALRQRSFRDPTARSLLPQVQESYKSLQDQLEKKQREADHLLLAAPRAGTILPPQEQPKREHHDSDTLGSWHGTPLDRHNVGAFLPVGTLVCRVGDPSQWEARLVIDQADMPFVQVGQQVKINLDELPLEIFYGQIDQVSLRNLQYTPPALSGRAGGEVASRSDPSGLERPLRTSYEAQVKLHDREGLLRIGLRGQAKIYVGSRTLAQRLWRFLAETFRFRM